VLTLIFKKKYLSKILSGTKTATRRNSRPKVKEGRTYNLRVNYRGSLSDQIKIRKLYKQRLDEMKDEDAHKEGFNDLDGFIEAWVEIYGSWNPSKSVWVVEFIYVGNENFKEKTLS
jgi:hypothetical protein